MCSLNNSYISHLKKLTGQRTEVTKIGDQLYYKDPTNEMVLRTADVPALAHILRQARLHLYKQLSQDPTAPLNWMMAKLILPEIQGTHRGTKERTWMEQVEMDKILCDLNNSLK